MEEKFLCAVNHCPFWGIGNICTADAIYVVSLTGETADNSRETDCNTF
ncbi:DUF1540 domain-containing protein [Bacillus vallismortis]|nr:DUF1540 domain-containing protein [Bacillus vallismortis]